MSDDPAARMQAQAAQEQAQKDQARVRQHTKSAEKANAERPGDKTAPAYDHSNLKDLYQVKLDSRAGGTQAARDAKQGDRPPGNKAQEHGLTRDRPPATEAHPESRDRTARPGDRSGPDHSNLGELAKLPTGPQLAKDQASPASDAGPIQYWDRETGWIAGTRVDQKAPDHGGPFVDETPIQKLNDALKDISPRARDKLYDFLEKRGRVERLYERQDLGDQGFTYVIDRATLHEWGLSQQNISALDTAFRENGLAPEGQRPEQLAQALRGGLEANDPALRKTANDLAQNLARDAFGPHRDGMLRLESLAQKWGMTLRETHAIVDVLAEQGFAPRHDQIVMDYAGRLGTQENVSRRELADRIRALHQGTTIGGILSARRGALGGNAKEMNESGRAGDAIQDMWWLAASIAEARGSRPGPEPERAPTYEPHIGAYKPTAPEYGGLLPYKEGEIGNMEGKQNELHVARSIAGTLARDRLRPDEDLSVRFAGIDGKGGVAQVDVIGPNGEFIAVGGPAKFYVEGEYNADKASRTIRSLWLLRGAADSQGVKAQAYFTEDTPARALAEARKVLGDENVKTFSRPKYSFPDRQQ